MPLGKHVTVDHHQFNDHSQAYYDKSSPWYHLSVTVEINSGKKQEESSRTQLSNGVVVRDALDDSPHKKFRWHHMGVSQDVTLPLPESAGYIYKNVMLTNPDERLELPKIFIKQGGKLHCLGWIMPETTIIVTGVKEKSKLAIKENAKKENKCPVQ